MGHFCRAAGKIFTKHNRIQGESLKTIVVLARNSMFQWAFYRLVLGKIFLFAKFSSSGVAKTVNKMINLKSFLH